MDLNYFDNVHMLSIDVWTCMHWDSGSQPHNTKNCHFSLFFLVDTNKVSTKNWTLSPLMEGFLEGCFQLALAGCS